MCRAEPVVRYASVGAIRPPSSVRAPLVPATTRRAEWLMLALGVSNIHDSTILARIVPAWAITQAIAAALARFLAGGRTLCLVPIGP